MKKLLITLLICMLAIPATTLARKKYNSKQKTHRSTVTHYYDHSHHGSQFDDFYLDREDDVIFIVSEYSDDEVEITPDFEMSINGDKIKLNKDQKTLVKKFYEQADELMKLSAEIGDRGAKIGVIGSAIGYRASRQAYLSLASSLGEYGSRYDDDELEDAIDKLEERLEELEDELEDNEDDLDRLTEEIEEQADDLEDQVDELEETFDDMLVEIPELDDLDW